MKKKLKFKPCLKCEKPFSKLDFYSDKQQPLGYSRVCKSCSSLQCKRYYKRHSKKLISYQKKYYKKHTEKVQKRIYAWAKRNRPKINDTLRKYRARNAETLKANNQRWINKDPAHYKKTCKERRKKYTKQLKANALLNRKVVGNKIKRHPCVICGNKKSEGHHNDYNKPLEVIWFCHKHHMAWHRLFIPEK